MRNSIIVYKIIISGMPRVAKRYSFALLAIDCVVCGAFPYRHRNIMKPRVVLYLYELLQLLYYSCL